MSNQYSRSQKPNKSSEKSKSRKRPKEHLKTGLTAFQTTVAIVGSCLGIITAIITINNFMNNQSKPKADDTKTTIIKEIEKTPSENQPAETTSNYGNDMATTQTADATTSISNQGSVSTPDATLTSQAQTNAEQTTN